VVARVTLEIALRREFDYLIPPELEGRVEVGTRVKVPFGRRQVLGCVTGLAEQSDHETLKPIAKIIGAQSLVTPQVLELARWIAEYYCCAPETALKSVLPDAVRKEQEGWRERLHVRLLPGREGVEALTKRQLEVYQVIEENRSLAMQELLKLTGTTAQTVRKLEDKGLVEIAPQISERDPYADEEIVPTQPLTLNTEQATALEEINDKPGDFFLLHGVTGSGKTEVYLQAIAHALEQGKGAIVLVPEIALTPQTVERFKARFSTGLLKTLVAVLHSHLSAGERHDEWHKIRQGRAKIVIGARSAIFAPVEPLGLIIVDEEHEPSYKQEEAPRYHARDVAVVRGKREGATVVLGSATPSMESYHNAKRGRYQLLEMPSRADHKQMPLVRVQDMRTEKSKGDQGPPIFSQRLKEAIRNRLEQGEQTILFLNRRGFATSMQCPDCGFVAECPNCSLSLTYHRREQFLRCHVCGHAEAAPRRCPSEGCGSAKIRFHGLGTEKVEDVLRKLFPNANVTRMDSDALKRKEDYRRILGDFRRGKIDILVGTQMIAKGLHFPRVTLVGIVYADTGLHLADFRAGERTFQLLTQVAGRAGRGEVEGEVVVQTFSPVHPAIQFSRRHDYEGYFEAEMEFREQLRYPPFTRAAMLTLRGRNEEKVSFSADHVKKQIEPLTESMDDLQISGPAPAPLLRAETFYRYQLMLRTGRMSELSRHLAGITAGLSFPDDVTLTVDIDPVNLL
jgi:primosomal protein N' (replication factor Y)|tara:strand:+ start:360 stop:2567 length:2208 start_codon:yes stop_codon:yes gene_type:complete